MENDHLADALLWIEGALEWNEMPTDVHWNLERAVEEIKKMQAKLAPAET